MPRRSRRSHVESSTTRCSAMVPGCWAGRATSAAPLLERPSSALRDTVRRGRTAAAAGRACRWSPRLACAARAAGRGEGPRGRRGAGKALVEEVVPVGSGAGLAVGRTPGPAKVAGRTALLRRRTRRLRRCAPRPRPAAASAAGAVHPAFVTTGRSGGPARPRAYAHVRHLTGGPRTNCPCASARAAVPGRRKGRPAWHVTPRRPPCPPRRNWLEFISPVPDLRRGAALPTPVARGRPRFLGWPQ